MFNYIDWRWFFKRLFFLSLYSIVAILATLFVCPFVTAFLGFMFPKLLNEDDQRIIRAEGWLYGYVVKGCVDYLWQKIGEAWARNKDAIKGFFVNFPSSVNTFLFADVEV